MPCDNGSLEQLRRQHDAYIDHLIEIANGLDIDPEAVLWMMHRSYQFRDEAAKYYRLITTEPSDCYERQMRQYVLDWLRGKRPYRTPLSGAQLAYLET